MVLMLNREAVSLLIVFRTVKVALPYDNALLQTGIAFNRACQIVLDYGSQAKSFNKNKLNREAYRRVRGAVSNLPSALVQTARDAGFKEYYSFGQVSTEQALRQRAQRGVR